MGHFFLRVAPFQRYLPDNMPAILQLFRLQRNFSASIAPHSTQLMFGKKNNTAQFWNKQQIRMMSKFHRKVIRVPTKVYLPGDQIPQPGDKNPVEKMPLPSSIEATPVNMLSKKRKKVDDETEANEVFSSVMGEVLLTKGRKLIALEGSRLIVEALSAGLKLEKLFLRRNATEIPKAINNFLRNSSSAAENSGESTTEDSQSESAKNSQNSSVEILKVSLKHMQTWSSVTTPPGVIGIFKKPSLKELSNRLPSAIPVTVICDNIREPGNLGALLRAAAGAGCKRILLSKGCTDAWDGKVLRAGSGAHFYLPITTEVPIHTISSYISFDSDSQQSPDSAASSFTASHSVNDAQEIKETIPEDTQGSPTAIFLADSNTNDSRTHIPIRSYTDVDYSKYGNIYVVVGGETEGLSTDTLQIAKNLSQSHNPVVQIERLQIPLQCKMESLNVAHAFAVIIFEILRQRQKQTLLK